MTHLKNEAEETVLSAVGESTAEALAPSAAAFPEYRQEVKRVWNHNSAYWDENMGEGNDFVNDLCWPAIEELLSIQSGQLGHWTLPAATV